MTERPDVAKTLASPIWYVDRKGEVTDGQEPWFKNPVFMVEPGGKNRVYVKYVSHLLICGNIYPFGAVKDRGNI